MGRMTAQALDIRLSNLSHIEKLNLIAQIREVCFGHELDALTEGVTAAEEFVPVCPECGCVEYSRYGYRADGRPRCKCKGCGRIYAKPKRKTMIEASRLPKSKWMRFISCFVDVLTYKAAAERCGVSPKTAHYMGMRVMSLLAAEAREWVLGAGMLAQVDEAFVFESFKGNRSKCADFQMPRPAYARGRLGDRSLDRAQGMNKADYLCVVSGVDESRRCFFEISGRGCMDKKGCKAALDGRVMPGSRVVTDDNNAYDEALGALGAEHSKYVSADHGPLNHVNSLHSYIKSFMRGRRAVSSRRLPLYLAAFAWRWESAFNRTAAELSRKLARSMAASDFKVTAEQLRAAAYPFVEWWHGAAGAKENRRMELARIQHSIDVAERKADGDPEKLADVAKRRAELVALAEEENVRVKGANISGPKKERAYRLRGAGDPAPSRRKRVRQAADCGNVTLQMLKRGALQS